MTPNGTVASESDRRDHFKVRSWLIDGEVVCCDERGLARFDVLRRRRNEAVVFLYAFDLLELDGVDLRREPLEVRNPTLASILRKPRDGLRLNEPRTPGGTRRVPARMRGGARELSRSGWARTTAAVDRRTGSSSRIRLRRR